MLQDPIVSPLSHQLLQNFNVRKKQNLLFVIHGWTHGAPNPSCYKKYKQHELLLVFYDLQPFLLGWEYGMPIGLMLWLRITGKDPRFVHSNISYRTPDSFTDHLKSSAMITFLQSSWSSFRMHGIGCVCAPHTHTKSTHSSECSELICMPATFVCYLLNCPQWSDITHVHRMNFGSIFIVP